MLDPSEIDRIGETTRVPLTRLVDWKNRGGEPFHLKTKRLESGLYRCEIDLPDPFVVEGVMPLVHGEFEKRELPDEGALVYASLPGNTLGQTVMSDGRPTFGVAYDLTTLDAEGRPQLKIYFGTASQWYVKNEYHARWNALREVREELEPSKKPAQPREPLPPPRDFSRPSYQQAPRQGQDGKRRGRGRRGGRGRNKAR